MLSGIALINQGNFVAIQSDAPLLPVSDDDARTVNVPSGPKIEF